MRFFSFRSFIFFFAFLAVIFSLNLISPSVKNFFYSLSFPVQKVLWEAGGGTAHFFRAISRSQILRAENSELKTEIQKLLAKNSELLELGRENEVLRQSLGIGAEKEYKLEIAEVISKNIFQDSVLINKGSAQGLTSGSPVITPEKVLVGRVLEVFKNSSEVVLISNKDVSFDAKTLDGSVYGVAKGKGNLQISLELVPKEKNLEKKDVIVTASLGGVFPANLLVGEVEEGEKSDTKPFQAVKIKPAFAENELKYLLIITNL
ncbi:MAG: rod shape-determining protein MreC [bacterium]